MKEKLIITERVYTYQIDFIGHVNNIVYIQWLENARVKLLEAIGLPVTELIEKHGIFPVLTKTAIRYRKPFFLNNTVTVEVWVSQLNNASADMDFNFKNEQGELCTTARQSCLFTDKQTMRPLRLSGDYRTAFEKYLVAEQAAL